MVVPVEEDHRLLPEDQKESVPEFNKLGHDEKNLPHGMRSVDRHLDTECPVQSILPEDQEAFKAQPLEANEGKEGQQEVPEEEKS